MAHGRPVVASSVDSLNELIPSEEFGYKVPIETTGGIRRLDPAALAGALARALDDPAEAEARGAAARRRILGTFTNARFATGLAGTCEAVMARHRVGGSAVR